MIGSWRCTAAPRSRENIAPSLSFVAGSSPDGWVCVGTLGDGGITAISPTGSQVDHIAMPDLLVTNICFRGAEPIAYCTLSGAGQLIEVDWPRPGLALAHEA